MKISKSTYELLLPINAAIKNTLYITSVVDNNNGTYTLIMCGTLWATQGFTLTINSAAYKIKSIVPDVSITVSGLSLPIPGPVSLYMPKFYHGSIRATQTQLDAKANGNLMFSDKMPMIWLHEPVDEVVSNREQDAIGMNSNCELYFVVDANFAQWTQDEHYMYAIRPMHNLIDAWYESMKISGLVNEYLIEHYKRNDLPRFGTYVDKSGAEKTIFALFEMSGTKVGITIPWLRTDINCCNVAIPIPPTCADSTAENSDLSYVRTIASGGTLNLSDQTVNITRDSIVIDTFTFIPMQDATGTVSPPIGDCETAIVRNSNSSYVQSIESGDTLELEDQEYIVTIDGVFNTSFTLPSMKDQTVNLIATP